MNETASMTSAPRATTKDDKGKPGTVGETVEVVKTIVYALLIALVLRILLFQPYTIPSASMQPNLFQGDYIIVSKFSYGYSRHSIPFSPPIFSGRIFGRQPHRGDIIVFKLPRDGHTDYIKRLVGLPGDRIQVKHSRLYLNDAPVPAQSMGVAPNEAVPDQQTVEHVRETMPGGKTYLTSDWGDDSPADNTGVYVVPQGCYFMMGDNRDNSADSRFDSDVPGGGKCGWDPSLDEATRGGEGVGFVPAENLVGKAQLIMLSWNEHASLFKPWTWFLDARPSRFFKILH
jgi:signal peptidase I